MSPRSNEPPSPEAKERRARNRAAQLKFRKKKQEVDETRCNRMRHLESVVEKMSTVLVDFTDGLLEQEVVKQSPGMIASIQGVITDILTLANEAGDPEQDPKALRTPVSQLLPTSDDCHFPNAPCKRHPDKYAYVWKHNSAATGSSSGLHPRTLPTIDDPGAAQPSFVDILIAPSIPEFFHLSIDSPLPLSEESRMFGSTLRYRERDEMISRMRWLLGPGKHELQTLAELPWGGRWWDQEFSGSDLANYATNATMADSSAPQFLSVLGVEKQLKALGARFVNKDTIELDSSALAILSGNRLEPSCAQPESWSFVNLFPSKDSRPQIDAPKRFA
ncbi:hypothetical protein F52700_2733 [Fusarium sp. NRRL 52700]|nr:hypothetical protein F52700_2733 [Fusarium sp. NRRL 52700]